MWRVNKRGGRRQKDRGSVDNKLKKNSTWRVGRQAGDGRWRERGERGRCIPDTEHVREQSRA